MENSKFKEQLGKLVSLTDFPIISEDTCWFDGDKCPYGLPQGKFQLRPTQFCHLDTGGCHRLLASRAEFENNFGVNEAEAEWELRPEDIEQILADEVPKLINKRGLVFSEVLGDISSDETESFTAIERKVLEIAANILVGSGSDCKLITENFDFKDFDL